jgi:hypothetical protein
MLQYNSIIYKHILNWLIFLHNSRIYSIVYLQYKKISYKYNEVLSFIRNSERLG